MEELVGPHELEKFKIATKFRWKGEEGSSMMHCITHDTFFSILEEPCWKCYQEFDWDEADI